MRQMLSNRDNRLKTLCFVALFLSVSAMRETCLAAEAENQKIPSEERVKTAFLFNFVKFVDWPSGVFADNNSPVLIGIIGDDPLSGELEASLRGKNINGRKLIMRRIAWPGEIKGMHILMVCASESRAAQEILASVKGKPVLTIGEMDRFGQQGGIINFFIEEKKVRFEINIDAADKARLKISSQLLALARIIRDNPRAERM
jgi:hypothetical protein